MNQASPPIRSFGQLAKRSLADSGWPADVVVQHRSLASLLSRFDRELDLDWLNMRPECGAVFARLLGCGLTDFHSAARPHRIDNDATRRVRFHDARFARALDLLDEGLPPGIPSRLSEPSSWGRLWWHAPSGSGRTLAGRWLAARALAFRESLESQRGRSPAYLELPERVRTALLLPWARDGVCIAASFIPHAFVQENGFEVIGAPAPSQFIPDLVLWMAQRLPADGHFDVDTALDWLSQLEPIAEREHTFGTVLGLCGLLDEFGSREVIGKSRAQLLERQVRRKLLEARERGSEDAAWLARHVSDVFMPFVARALTDGRHGLTAPRSMDEWLELVPEEHRRGPDLDWMRLSLTNEKAGLSAREVERAARRVPPGAFRILRALQASEILTKTSHEQFVLRPQWLVRVAEQEAFEQLIQGSGFEWGEALLAPETQGRAMSACLARARRSGEVRLDTTNLGAEDSAAAMAALETEARAVGLAIALQDSFDAEQVAALLEEARALWVDLPEQPPLPRLACAASDDAPLADGWFHLAMLALTESVNLELGRRRAGPPSELNPWGSDKSMPSDRLLDSIASAVDGPFKDLGLHVAAVALVDRLRRHAGRSCDSKGSWHRLQLPGRAIELATERKLQWSSLVPLVAADFVALLPLAGRSALGEAAFAQSVIAAWKLAGAPKLSGSLLDPELESSHTLWKHATEEQLLQLLQRDDHDLVSLLGSLSEEVVASLAAQLADLPAGSQIALWTALPLRALRALLDASPGLPEPGALVAWQRGAPAVQRALRRWLFETPELAVRWLVAAPEHQLIRALEPLARVDRLDRLPESSLSLLRSHLHQVVRERPIDVRVAYLALARLEREAFPKIA